MSFNPNVTPTKITYEGDTLLDLTGDTVTANKLLIGYTAHNAAGQTVTGTCNYNCNTSSDTVTAATLASGYTAHNSSGQAITGTMPSVTVNSLSVTENGTYTAPTGTAYSPVTVNVSGGGGDSGLKKAELDANGNVIYPTSLDVSAIKTIPNNILGQWQYNNTALTGVLNFTNLQTMGNASLASGFQNCQNITGVHFPALTSMGNNALGYCFFACVRIATISFPSLVSVQANAFSNAFTYCQALSGSISFPSLTTITGNAFFANTFQNCPNVTAIHFKASIQSTIEAQTGFASKFGATNATIYFDL